MATVLKLRRGTTAEHSTFTGAEGEVTVDITKDTLVVHDGSTAGGFPLALESDVTGVISLTDLSATDAGGDGSFTYDNSTGAFTYTGPSAAEVRAHFSAGTGITLTDGAIATTITQYTDSLARAAISVTDSGGDGSLSYNSSTGVITYAGPSASDVRAHFSASTGISITDGAISTTITQYTDALTRAAVSVTDSGGDGSLSYDNSTGVITYTGPSASDVRAHFSAGTGVALSDGQISIGQAVGTTSDVTFNDLTVSGNLTVSGTTTTVNTETINLADNIILLNSNEAGTPSQNAGIEVERGTSTNKTLVWDETADKWTVGSETFVAGTFEGALTGNVTGNVTGNADTATSAGKWTTARTITLGGDLTGNVSIDGSANVTLTATVAANSVALGTDTTGDYVAGATAGNYITVSGTAGEGWSPTIAVDATSANTASKVVARDASGDFAAGTITASLSGNASTATSAGKWTTARSITLGGDLSGSVSLDGSSNVTLTATVAANSVALGTDTTGDYVADVTAGSYITKTGSAGEGWSPTIAVDATSANTASKVVARDASGDFAAGTITASLDGNASTVTNGVYTTDTGTVTNTMLAGSIANDKLSNSAITIAGTSVSLGGSFTATNILDAIKTVDGSGSGLDSDLLDGQSSAYYRINIYDASGTLLN